MVTWCVGDGDIAGEAVKWGSGGVGGEGSCISVVSNQLLIVRIIEHQDGLESRFWTGCLFVGICLG